VPDTLRAFLLPFASYFRKKGWTVDAAAAGIYRYEECINVFDKVWEVPWTRNFLDLNNLFSASRVIREIVKQGNYDIVHVHTPIAAFITRWALRKERKRNLKVIYTAHGFHFIKGGPRFKNFFFIVLEKLAGRWTDYLVVINKDDHESALKYRLINSANLLYIPGIGLDIRYYDPDTVSVDDVEKVRNELGLGDDDKYFLMIGEFNKNKCQSESVRALSRLNDPTIHIVFAGEGSTMSSVRELAKDLGIADRIHLLGYRKDIPRLLKGSLALLLTSRREGLPRCILEAMSLEVPVIATDIRGSRELLADGAGILYQPGNIENLMKAMDYIINNPEEAGIMGSIGRKQVMEMYELGMIIRLHESLYERVWQEIRALTEDF
jgi:glycosyltransferase involved in cell wall biosynthesis